MDFRRALVSFFALAAAMLLQGCRLVPIFPYGSTPWPVMEQPPKSDWQIAKASFVACKAVIDEVWEKNSASVSNKFQTQVAGICDNVKAILIPKLTLAGATKISMRQCNVPGYSNSVSCKLGCESEADSKIAGIAVYKPVWENDCVRYAKADAIALRDQSKPYSVTGIVNEFKTGQGNWVSGNTENRMGLAELTAKLEEVMTANINVLHMDYHNTNEAYTALAAASAAAEPAPAATAEAAPAAEAAAPATK